MKTKAIEISYIDKVLRGYVDLPEEYLETGDRIPAVIQLHGMCGQCDSKIDLALAKYFVMNNCCVIRVNFLGHGNSDGDLLEVTVPDQLFQAEAIFHYVKNLPFVESEDITLVGHSMGVIPATMLAGKYPDQIRKMIHLAPAYIIEILCQTGQFGPFSYDPSNPPEKIELSGTKFKFSRDYLITGKDINIIKWITLYQGPVCVIHGDFDDFLPIDIIKPYVEQFQKGQLKIVKGASHFFGGMKEQMVSCVDEFIHSIYL